VMPGGPFLKCLQGDTRSEPRSKGIQCLKKNGQEERDPGHIDEALKQRQNASKKSYREKKQESIVPEKKEEESVCQTGKTSANQNPEPIKSLQRRRSLIKRLAEGRVLGFLKGKQEKKKPRSHWGERGKMKMGE